MKKKLLLTMAAAVVAAVATMAVPAKPGVTRTVTLADGSTVELTLQGDEHYSFYTDANGMACQLANGRLHYIATDVVTKTWTSLKNERFAQGGSRRAASASRRVGTPSTATMGKHRGLVILMEFQDVKFATPNTQATYMRFFNEAGYNDGGMAGSVHDYFLKQSYNQLEIDFDVVGPFTTGADMAYYGEPVKDSSGKITQNDKNAPMMIAEAVDAASKVVDFTDYDWDGDGNVDQVFVIYAGYSQAQGGEENTIWPHEWSLAAKSLTRTYNGKTINTYGCAAELSGNSGTNMDGIGTACHEFSHCLGLPDMYDTNGQRWFGMSYWDVMDGGSYNDSSRTPAGYTSYERWFSGWMEPKEITSMTRVSDMKPLATSPEAYILYNDGNRNEYYLLENRQPVDFDKGLYGHGLLIIHVDYDEEVWGTNTVNNAETHQRMTPVPADNMLQQTRASLAGDPWPGTSGNTSLTNYTTPAAVTFNANTDGQKLMNKPIDNITENTEANTVSFVACRPEMDVPQPGEAKELTGSNSFSVTWPAVSGATGYEVELTTTDRAATNPADALTYEVDFADCYSASAGFKDISSSLGNYGLSGWSGSKLYTTPQKLRIGTSSATGNIQTAQWHTPSSSNFTVVVGANVVKAGTVKVQLQLQYASVGEYWQSADPIWIEVSGDGRQIIHFEGISKDYIRLNIIPSAQLYLNYLAIYDGIWTEEQLGLAAAVAPRRATSIQVFATKTNSYTFTNMDMNKHYAFRVRALGEENAVSQWSDSKAFEFSTTEPPYVVGDANGDGVVDVADVVAIVNKILEKPAENFNEKAADVNGDGVIDVSDVVGVVNLILK